MVKKGFVFFCIICAGFLCNSIANDNEQKKIVSSLGDSSYTHLNINNISTFFFNNGMSDNNQNYNGGFFFPKGSFGTAVYATGFLWGAKVLDDPQVRVGGSSYRSGLQGGKIISEGIAENPKAENVRIYRVRRDVYPGGQDVDLSSEIADEKKTSEQIRAQYEKDWKEWRAVDGAPFEDINANGVYDPVIDIPGFPGADQTIWYVANDLDSSTTKYLYGTLPLGVELQVTAWSYSTDDYLNNMIFRKYVMINKSSTIFKDVYVTLWSDTDLGDAGDDFVGCDTTLSLGFDYNAFEKDNSYYPSPPPAIGFKLLKGPSISESYNLPMTAFYPTYKSTQNDGDPIGGDPAGANQFYNLMRGKHPYNGKPFIDGLTGDSSTFPLSGDPITQQGWIDGSDYPGGRFAGDRRCGIASGPFQMAVGDTQKIIFAEIAAMGTDRLQSVKILKDYSRSVQDFYNSDFKLYSPPKTPIPVVKVKGTIAKVRLNWGEDTAVNNTIENYSKEGYKFQGYNVYQLSANTITKEGAKKIATYDIVDGVTEIHQTYNDPITRLRVDRVEQSGSDSGIKRAFSTDFDSFENSHMLIGKKYYFAVTAYIYNSDPSASPSTSESLVKVIEVTYYENYPGPDYGDVMAVDRSTESEESNINVTVEDPTKLTGDKYEVFFTERDEVLNENGDWVAASSTNKTSGNDSLPKSSTALTVDDTRSIKFLTRRAKYWNVKDVSKDAIVLENQSIVNGKDLFPPRNDIPNKGNKLPGPMVDGFRIEADVNYEQPSNFSSIRKNYRSNTFFYVGDAPSAREFVMSNYSIFAGTVSSRAIDNFGIGTSDVKELKQDYTLDFSGTMDSSLVNGRKIFTIKNGGSMATLFAGKDTFSLANHPLNPNPGSSAPFLVRIPFEVWNKDKNIQVNFMFKDRKQESNANPFYVWNPNDRMYGIIVNSPYDTNTPITLSPSDKNNAAATWALVFWSTRYHKEDTLTITYPNPIQFGVDKFTFTAPRPIREVGNIDLDSYVVFQNYPNPFNPATKIRFYLPVPGLVKVDVFNILGQRVARLANDVFAAGIQEIEFAGNRLASGMYIYTVEVNDKFFEAKKMLLVK